LLTLNDQRVISQADIQWVLNQARIESQLVATFIRERKVLEKTIALSGAWKESDLSWRPSTGPGLRYGLLTVALSDGEHKQVGVPAGRLALRVKAMAMPRTAPLQEAGLRTGDVIVSVNGKTDAMTESQFLADLRLNYPPGHSVKLTVLRGKERRELTIPMW
jgi:predicted metalloprotease with PDZ domain